MSQNTSKTNVFKLCAVGVAAATLSGCYTPEVVYTNGTTAPVVAPVVVPARSYYYAPAVYHWGHWGWGHHHHHGHRHCR